jgi:hypothetical protein
MMSPRKHPKQRLTASALAQTKIESLDRPRRHGGENEGWVREVSMYKHMLRAALP